MKTPPAPLAGASGENELAEIGKLSTAELVRLRVCYFTDIVALGSKEFVDGIFEARRDQFGPELRLKPLE